MIISSSSDWITLTSGRDCREAEQDWEEGGTTLKDMYDDVSLVSTGWQGMGYEGVQCTETKVRYGQRAASKDHGRKEEILIGSGKHSDAIIDLLPTRSKTRCTRIDIQATCYLSEVQRGKAQDWYALISESQAAGESLTKRRKAKLVLSETGETLYVGKRGSGGKIFRFYDKSNDVQSPLGMVWRQEVEYGRRYAEGALRWYVENKEKDEAVVGQVHNEFVQAMGLSLLAPNGCELELIPEQREGAGTMDGKIKWLERCVRPTIYLMWENDRLDAAIDALGIFELLES